MFKKGFSTISIIVIVLVVIAGGVLAWQYWPEPAEQEPITEDQGEIEQPATNKGTDETADWETYRSEKYGFEVKYASNFIPSERVFNIGTQEEPFELFSLSFNLDSNRVFLFRETSHQYLFEGHPHIILDEETGESITKEVIVDGAEGLNFRESNEKGGPPDYFSITAIKKDNKVYEFWGEGEVFNQMLSTFRFLESDVKTMNLKVYFMDKQMMIEGTSDYEDVAKPVIRTVPKTQAVAKTAIEELLKGLMDNEKATYSDSIPIGTKMNSISINNGIAYIDFSEELGSYGGGSATVNSIEWQIKKTLMQFPTVDSVEISIEGETEGILQP